MAATIQTGVQGVSPGLPGGTASACNLTSAQVIAATSSILNKVSCITGGTLTLNDCATTGAAAASNEFFNCVMTAGQVISLDWPCFAGIVASVVTSGNFALSFSS